MSFLTAPGFCHNLPISARALDVEDIRAGADGPRNDGDVVIGDNGAGGGVRLHYDTAAQWRDLALAATRLADWMEAT